MKWPDPSTMDGRVRSYKRMANISTTTAALLALMVAVLVWRLTGQPAAGLLIWLFVFRLTADRIDRRMFARRTAEIYATPLRDPD